MHAINSFDWIRHLFWMNLNYAHVIPVLQVKNPNFLL